MSKFLFAVSLAQKLKMPMPPVSILRLRKLQFVSRAKVAAELFFRCQKALLTVQFVIFLFSVTVLRLQAR